MKRRLLNLPTALLLLAVLGAAVLAVRSHWAVDMVNLRWNPEPPQPISSGRLVNCTSFPGILWLTVDRVTDADAGF